MKHVKDKTGLVLCHFKTKGKKLTVKDILSDEVCTKLVNLDEGYNILRYIKEFTTIFTEKERKMHLQ